MINDLENHVTMYVDEPDSDYDYDDYLADKADQDYKWQQELESMNEGEDK